MRPAGHGLEPRGGGALRALQPPAASMRQLPRYRRTVRPVLRILRTRDGAGRNEADVVAALVPGGADPAGRGTDLRNRAGARPPALVAPVHHFHDSAPFDQTGRLLVKIRRS